jgi:hypothetical protein
MQIQAFLHKLNISPNSIQFNDTIATVDANYQFTPTRFRNGEQINEAGQNSGSCKLFSFAKLQKLNEVQTLACFGDYYRVDVLQYPTASDHQNIRNFMQQGWAGIHFDGSALTPLPKDSV